MNTTEKKRYWLILFRILVIASIVVGLGYASYKAWLQLRQEPFELVRVDWILVALGVALNSMAIVVSALYWRLALMSLGGEANYLQAIRAFAFSQLGKYVPGKAMVVIIRSDLVRSERTKLGPAIASVFIETLMGVFVGAQIACGYFLFTGTGEPFMQSLAIIAMLVSGLVTIPPNFSKLVRFAGKFKRSASTSEPPKLTWRNFFSGILMMGASWMLAGASAHFVVKAIPNAVVVPSDYWLILSTFALATVAGVFMFMPGGLGVRELIIVPLLAPRFTVSVALVAAILIRLVCIVSELVVSGTIELLHRHLKSR